MTPTDILNQANEHIKSHELSHLLASTGIIVHTNSHLFVLTDTLKPTKWHIFHTNRCIGFYQLKLKTIYLKLQIFYSFQKLCHSETNFKLQKKKKKSAT